MRASANTTVPDVLSKSSEIVTSVALPPDERVTEVPRIPEVPPEPALMVMLPAPELSTSAVIALVVVAKTLWLATTLPSADKAILPVVESAAVRIVKSAPEAIERLSKKVAPSTITFPLAPSPIVIEENPSLTAAMSVSSKSKVKPAPLPIPTVAAAVACLKVRLPVPIMLLAPPPKLSSSEASEIFPPPVAVRVLEETIPVVAVMS